MRRSAAARCSRDAEALDGNAVPFTAHFFVKSPSRGSIKNLFLHLSFVLFLIPLTPFPQQVADLLNQFFDYVEPNIEGYSGKPADDRGIVYTPHPIVDFMCANAIWFSVC